MENVPGPLPKTVRFRTTGGNLVLMVSGSAFWTVANTNLVKVKFDTRVLGDIRSFTSEGQSHKAAVSRWFFVGGAAAGDHDIELLTDSEGPNATLTDANDYFSVTVFELPAS